jgi:hypothetical protein
MIAIAPTIPAVEIGSQPVAVPNTTPVSRASKLERCNWKREMKPMGRVFNFFPGMASLIFGRAFANMFINNKAIVR